MIPARFQPFGPDRFLGRCFLLEKVEGEVSQDRQVFRAMTSPNATIIFAEGDIEDPVEPIFDPPVGANDGKQLFGMGGQTGKIVTGLGGDGALVVPDGIEPDEGSQPRPGVAQGGGQWFEVAGRPAAARFNPPMVGVHGLVKGVRQVGEFRGPGLVKHGFHGGPQGRVIVFQGEDIVTFLFCDLPGNGGLAAHGVNRDDAALERQDPEQFRDGRDFIGMVRRFELAEHQLVLTGPGAHEVNSGGDTPPRPTQGFAVEVDHRSAGHFRDALHPVPEVFLKLLGVQPPEHVPKRVMRRDARRQFEKRLKPFLLAGAI